MGTIANAKVTHYYNCYNGDFIGCLLQNITTYNKTISFLQKKTIFHKRKNSRPDIPSLLLYELKNTFLYFAPFTNFSTVL